MQIRKTRIASARKNEAQKDANVSSPASTPLEGLLGEEDEEREVKSLPVTVLKLVTHTVRISARTEPSPTTATR